LLIGDYEGDGEEVLEEEVQQVLEPPMLRYLSFLTKESSKRYSNRIILFKEWCVKGNKDVLDSETLFQYAETMRSEDEYLSSTIFTVVVMLTTWYLQVHNLKFFTSILNKQLSAWAEDDHVKQAETFSMEQVTFFLTNAPDDEKLTNGSRPFLSSSHRSTKDTA
jgi:hypothetical protein